MWRRCECPRLTLPVAVFLKRLAAPLWVFSFGIVPRYAARNQLPATSCQPSVVVIYFSIALESSGQPDEKLSLRNRIRSLCGRCCDCWLLLCFRHGFRRRLF